MEGLIGNLWNVWGAADSLSASSLAGVRMTMRLHGTRLGICWVIENTTHMYVSGDTQDASTT